MRKLEPWLILQLLLLVACSSNHSAPELEAGVNTGNRSVVLDPGRQHRVNEDETLYSIAWIYDMDYQELAAINNISPPFTIYHGQILALEQSTRSNVPARPSTPSDTRTSVPIQNSTTVLPSANASTVGSPRWTWPAQGRILQTFSPAAGGNKGINIAGNQGDPVTAAEAGQVVYAGRGLLRYGDLIIIKHNAEYLSAYAHNHRILVNEGDSVRKGELIAELGATGVDRNMLHFEIRRNGTPVNPTALLPER